MVSDERLKDLIRINGKYDQTEGVEILRELLALRHQWVKVSERMPEPGRRVWIALPNGMTGKGYFRDERPDSRARSYWKLDGHNCDIPTHWMPIPNPPKDGE